MEQMQITRVFLACMRRKLEKVITGFRNLLKKNGQGFFILDSSLQWLTGNCCNFSNFSVPERVESTLVNLVN